MSGKKGGPILCCLAACRAANPAACCLASACCPAHEVGCYITQLYLYALLMTAQSSMSHAGPRPAAACHDKVKFA